ncbi:MAG: tRNA guanosine(34) transglycosylase Tgt, partial [Oscillospiraceae bacterium]|nr:tRNA guanosine(34) transglycosylase Tgt [Oscillospiraceae bacterium]MCL2278699.1 tRNA guanosine(34) transglycosylase Tgt [Oscillospiraceae bacterium]
RARRGEFFTARGVIKTPVFMNVATQASIKGGLSAFDLRDARCQVALANTYHLHIRPGDELIRSLGGLHRFMAWDGPILTDSGGFQIFSLAALRKISEDGVTFNSHVDGRRIFMSPEDSIRIQLNLGSDIIMAFDECIELPASYDYVRSSCERTYRWLLRCKAELESQGQAPSLFGINQGGTFADLRISHMKSIAELDLPGYAIGGLAVGESTQEMYDTTSLVEEYMPADKPRYLMGVGTPQNIIEAVRRGVDFFDCVMPARNGRHGKLYVWGDERSININNERFRNDDSPIDTSCECHVCAAFSRAYLRHLFKSGEMLGMRLAVMHNLFYYNTLMAKIREAIDDGHDPSDSLLNGGTS